MSFSRLVHVCLLLQRLGLEILRYQLWAVGMSHPSQLPPPGSFVTPETKARGMVPFERHTTPENIRRFFDPATYRQFDATPAQKRHLSPSQSTEPSTKSSRMDRLELLEKFKLAAKLNGVDWNDIVVSCYQFCTVLFFGGGMVLKRYDKQ